MKIVMIVIALMWLVGCSSVPKMSSEEAMVRTLVTHGCDVSEFNMNRTQTKMQVRCK